MGSNSNEPGFRIGGSLLNFITVILGIAAAYFLTIQSLKMEIADKAEGVVVETLDRKLASIEVMLTEGVVSREQFYRFSTDIEARLNRIEYYLIDKSGENIEKP
ncbi:MAG: hypothetical protein KAU36_00425 [candidate division Zixibacteria bacterium]|nr:hypothetical protein [candidate division Zixibacteria bacterium]